MPCSCDNTLLVQSDYGTVICTKCGLETQITLEPHEASPGGASFEFSPPIVRVYSRPDRWKTVVSKIVGNHPGPPQNDPVWDYLKNNSHKCSSPRSILQLLRKSGLKNKHYQCLHTFAKAFQSDYSPPRISPTVVEHKLGIYFDFVNNSWLKFSDPKSPFISYAWLLEQGLTFYGFREYLPFLKKLMCHTRRMKYVSILHSMYRKCGIHAGMRSHDSKDNHSPNESNHQENLHNLLMMHPTPDQLHDAHYRLSAVHAPSGWVQRLKGMCSLPPDTLEEFAELLERSQDGHMQLHALTKNRRNG